MMSHHYSDEAAATYGNHVAQNPQQYKHICHYSSSFTLNGTFGIVIAADL